MRAITFQAPEIICYEQVPEPAISDPGDALVRVRVAGVCGSDLHVYHGRETGLDAGTVMGHELVGEVIEVGHEVTSVGVGDAVFSPFSTSCGACFFCLHQLSARCSRGQLFGWVERGQGLHGAQAEYVRVPLAESTLVAIPEGVDDAAALLAGDVLATGLFAATLGGVAAGHTVVVLGAGPVGIMSIVAALSLGAELVFAVDGIAERLALASRCGAETIDRGSQDPVAVVRERTAGRGADVVIEAVGSPEATRVAYELVRAGGTIAAPGVHTEKTLAFSPVEAYDKNLTYRAGRCPARDFAARALELVRAKPWLTAIISHRLALADGVRAYDLFARKRDGCTKVVLVP